MICTLHVCRLPPNPLSFGSSQTQAVAGGEPQLEQRIRPSAKPSVTEPPTRLSSSFSGTSALFVHPLHRMTSQKLERDARGLERSCSRVRGAVTQ